MILDISDRDSPCGMSVKDLIEQAYFFMFIPRVTQVLGGLLPGLPQAYHANLGSVLDIGCGPGAWTLEMGHTYAHISVTGIDSNHALIRAAHRQRLFCHLENVHHIHVNSLLEPLPFADAAFDLISAQFLSRVLTARDWPRLLGECLRVLRPGGYLRITDVEVGMSNTPAHDTLWSLYVQAMRLKGHSFSSTDRHLGLLCAITSLLLTAGFCQVQVCPRLVDYSSGSPMHEEWTRELSLLSHSLHPWLVALGIVTQERCTSLYQQQQREMGLPTFCAMFPLFTAWASKPTAS